MGTPTTGACAPSSSAGSTRTGAGSGSYAYFWRGSDQVEHPMSIVDMLTDAAGHGAEVFQICDDPRLERLDDAGLTGLRRTAQHLGLVLEVGTRGTHPRLLREHLRVAEVLGARLVRSMWTVGGDRPDRTETEARLRQVVPDYARAGVTLALETYEQVPTRVLVDVVEVVGDEHLGICLDPANTVAALENPTEVTERCAPYVKNWHVKDFAFTRSDGWVGFTLTGAPLGEGLLDYDAVLTVLDPVRRGITRIAEHWLPWQGDPATTARTEAAWTATTMHRLTTTPDRNP